MAINVAAALDTALDDLVGRNKGGGKGKRARGVFGKRKGKGKGKGGEEKAGESKAKGTEKKKAAATEKPEAKSSIGAAKQLDMSLEDIVKTQARRKPKGEGKGASKKASNKAVVKGKLWAGAAQGRGQARKVRKIIVKSKDYWSDGKGKGKGKGKDSWSDWKKKDSWKGSGKEETWGRKGSGKGWGGADYKKAEWGGKGSGKAEWGGRTKNSSWEQSWGNRKSGGDSWDKSWSSAKKDDSWDRKSSGRESWAKKDEDWGHKDSGKTWKDSRESGHQSGDREVRAASRGGGDWGRRVEKSSYEDEFPSRTRRESKSSGVKIKVTNIPSDLSKADIKEAFEREAGRIARCDFSRGTAWIEFTNEKDAWKAVDTFDRGELNGKTIKVEFER